MALLRRNRAGYHRYLDRACIATGAGDRRSRTESDRGQPCATGGRTSRHSYGRAHAWANWFANYLRLQGGYLGDGSAAASTETAGTRTSNERWATCGWCWQPFITRITRVGTTKELAGEAWAGRSRDFMDNCPRFAGRM